MDSYNELPKDAKELKTYDEIRQFFAWHIRRQEFREPLLGQSILDESYDLRIFWVNKEQGLGFGIASNQNLKKIVWYKFGKDALWSQLNEEYKSKFKHDNT